MGIPDRSEAAPSVVDVIIVGGGPAGLMTAFCLKRAGVSSVVIEREDKSNQMYGRACTLQPRTLEIFDQCDLLDIMNQVGFLGRGSATFDTHGKRKTERGWHTIFSKMGDSFTDYCLNLRLKYSEEIFEREYVKLGGKMMIRWELTDIQANADAVTATVQNLDDGSVQSIKGKYLLGSDGGRSKVRQLAGIVRDKWDSVGPPLSWIRIDGHFKTNFPDNDLGFASIESPTHGNVLYVGLDHGANRIGYCLPPKRAEELNGTINEEQVIEETKKALAPWTVEFESIDWFTNYRINQTLARNYIKGRIILAGDACHTHSSGAAQGMNTGIHDAINLAWKLAGTLKGWYTDEVLQSYEDERRPSAEHLLELDQAFSNLLSGIIPDKYKGRASDPNVIWGMLWDESTAFNIGFGIHYPENIINHAAVTGNVTSGWRAPDALIYKPGSHIPTRLQLATKNFGHFWVVVFTGNPALTRPAYGKFRSEFDSSKALQKMEKAGVFQFVTLVMYERSLAELVLGSKPLGTVYYDNDGGAHRKYGLSPAAGGIAIIRADGHFAFATRLENGEEVEQYFSKFVKPDFLSSTEPSNAYPNGVTHTIAS